MTISGWLIVTYVGGRFTYIGEGWCTIFSSGCLMIRVSVGSDCRNGNCCVWGPYDANLKFWLCCIWGSYDANLKFSLKEFCSMFWYASCLFHVPICCARVACKFSFGLIVSRSRYYWILTCTTAKAMTTRSPTRRTILIIQSKFRLTLKSCTDESTIYNKFHHFSVVIWNYNNRKLRREETISSISKTCLDFQSDHQQRKSHKILWNRENVYGNR